MRVILNTWAAAALFVASAAGVATAEGHEEPAYSPSSTVLYLGVDVSPESLFGYTGAVFALNGDLGADGFLLRAFVGGGFYEYESGALNIDGEQGRVEFGVGYQYYLPSWRFTAYANAEYEGNSISPFDGSNSARGYGWGFRGIGEVETTERSSGYAQVLAQFGTVNTSYFTRARGGLRFEYVTLGSEFHAIGNSEYDELRGGIFFDHVRIVGNLRLGGGIGYSWKEGDGSGSRDEEGLYATLNTSIDF